MRKIGRTDPTTPIAGRTWYAGAWRTPEEIEMRREYVRSHRRRLGTKRAKREAGERMRDRSTPVPGRQWYAGRWRTPEEVVRVRERTRARNAARYRPSTRRPRLTPEERAQRDAEKRLRQREARNARQAERAAIREAKLKAATKAPTAVRDAWKRAHPNSVIRRKYPTLAALDASVLYDAGSSLEADA
jgi:hypothetical protein